jgi:hypothetical protein
MRSATGTSSQWERHKTHTGDALGACTPTAAKVAADQLKVSIVPDPSNESFVQLNVYPNPIKSTGLWIKFTNSENILKFKAVIYNLNGRKLAEKVFESNAKNEHYLWTFEHESWNDGIFILKIEDGIKTHYTRLLKLKN